MTPAAHTAKYDPSMTGRPKAYYCFRCHGYVTREHGAAPAAAYERVTYRPEGGRARTIYLHRPIVRGEFLSGVEVDRMGDEISGRKFDERKHIIEVSLVVRRVPMLMDNTYGELVEA